MAINHINIHKPQYYRGSIAKNIEKLIEQQELISNHRINQEWKTVKNIKQKLIYDNFILTRGDKGKTLIIIPKQIYSQKVESFYSNNTFIEMTHNPNEQYQKNDRK